MFERTESRVVVAAVAFMLLFAAGAGTLNWLAAAPFPAGVQKVVEEQAARPSPHLFLGEVKLASKPERQLGRLTQGTNRSATGLQAAEVLPVASPLAPAAELSVEKNEAPTTPLASATPFPADEKPHFFRGPNRIEMGPPAKPEQVEQPRAPLPPRTEQSSSDAQPAKLFAADRAHFFPGNLRLDFTPRAARVATVPSPATAKNERPLADVPAAIPGPAAAVKPAKLFPAGQPHFFPGNMRLASVSTPAPGPAKPVQPTAKPSVQQASFSASEPRIAELPQRVPGTSIVVRPAEAQPAQPGKYVAGQMHLVSLPQRFPVPAVALNPAEVMPVQSGLNPTTMLEFQLASLQQRAPEPATPLQPAEVLPIPMPNSPAAPRVTELDQDRPISALTTNIAPPEGKLPMDLAVEKFRGDFPAWLPRPWSEVAYFWDAPDLCFGGLRYEEANLERFGYSHCPLVQPAISAAHFFCATLALPYSMTVHPHGECIYPLGHYRPGSPVPFRHIRPEANVLAATAEVGTIAGLILLIP